MRLVLRRARGAKRLLAAAIGATLIATALLTGLAIYSQAVVNSGAGSVLRFSPASERSVLVRGPAGGSAGTLQQRDEAVHAHLADGLGGQPATVSAAGYSSGRQLTGDLGDAVPDGSGLVFASVMFLDGLAEHAELTAGAWPRPGALPVQAALAAPVAGILGVSVGDRVPVTNRLDDQITELVVTGLWRPRDPTESYWRLTPDVTTGVAPQSSTYGPLVVDRADFTARFMTNASAAWLVEPDLAPDRITLAQLRDVGAAATRATTELPEVAGLGSAGLADTGIHELVDRLARADLVGRSALVTPILLVIVLGGYALLLVASQLGEQRRGEGALLRARGASRAQLAALAVREAALVVVPAALLAPFLANEVLEAARRLSLLPVTALRFAAPTSWLSLLVVTLAAAGCVLAMLVPALRRGRTYVAELAERSRPTRGVAVARAGADLALVGLALLGWWQLRQYSSPLTAAGSTGALGIDPLLAATPTIGVLAGAVLALRLLPPATRFAERYVDRRPWVATTLGMWQAGRRPHAGPVLLLALAVAVSTLAWCLAATSERSLTEQANHQVGADLRLVETSGMAPDGRAGQLAALPGAERVLPAWRDSLRLGLEAVPGSLVAIDTEAGASVLRIREDLIDGESGEVLRDLAVRRPDTGYPELPVGGRVSGRIATRVAGVGTASIVSHYLLLADAFGGYRRLPLGDSVNSRPLAFDVATPTGSTGPAGSGPGPEVWRLAGFLAETTGLPGARVRWELSALAAVDTAGTARPLDLRGDQPWQAVDRNTGRFRARLDGGTLAVDYVDSGAGGNRYRGGSSIQFAVVRQITAAPLPVLATPEALAALRLGEGGRSRLWLGVREMEVEIAGTATAVPGTGERAALLVDLPSFSRQLLHEGATLRAPQEWWVDARPGEHGATAGAAAQLGGLRVLDREAVTEQLTGDPYGVGARVALFAAALGALLLAAVGISVDVSATARRRITEFAVLQTLGAGSRLLARALLAEQAFLAGLGVLVGAAVGITVAAAMAPLVILTPAADRPWPPPLLRIDWPPVLATTLGLLALALALSALVALSLRQRLAAAALRIGEDR